MKNFLLIFALIAVSYCQDDSLYDPKSFVNVQKSENLFEKIRTRLHNGDGDSSNVADISPSIIGGELSWLGQLPHQVLVIINDDPFYHVKGGALIKHRWVLTCAHIFAFFPNNSLSVHYGINNLTAAAPGNRIYINNTDHIHVHPDFNIDETENLAYDIALLYLQNAPDNLLSLPNVRIIPLPYHDLNTHGRIATLSGWGWENVNIGEVSWDLRLTRLPVVDISYCNEFYRNYSITFDDSQMCILTMTYAAPCHGDEGGPVTAVINSRTTLVGITSFTYPFGCNLAMPAVVTRVSSHLDWIHRVSMSPKSLMINVFALIGMQVLLILIGKA